MDREGESAHFCTNCVYKGSCSGPILMDSVNIAPLDTTGFHPQDAEEYADTNTLSVTMLDSDGGESLALQAEGLYDKEEITHLLAQGFGKRVIDAVASCEGNGPCAVNPDGVESIACEALDQQ